MNNSSEHSAPAEPTLPANTPQQNRILEMSTLALTLWIAV